MTKLLPLFLFVFVISCTSNNSQEKPSNDVSTQQDSAQINIPDTIAPAPLVPHKNLAGHVLGWQRITNDDRYKEYRYDLISMFAYFSYKVNPENGLSLNKFNWSNVPAIDSAEANHCDVYLTISCFGPSETTEFLQNDSAQQTLIQQTQSLLSERSAQGICVDFEEVPHKMGTNYQSFLSNLAAALHPNNQKIIVVLPIYAEENVLNPDTLISTVDYYIMMGYADYHLHSSHAGPISPLYHGDLWQKYSLVANIDGYLGKGYKKETFMVALPLYGTIWETESKEKGAKSVKGIKETTYAQIKSQFDYPPEMDDTSKSAYYAYTDPETNTIRQCWFESEESMRIKFEYLKNRNLAGTGLWALGYDHGHQEIWNTIDSVYSVK